MKFLGYYQKKLLQTLHQLETEFWSQSLDKPPVLDRTQPLFNKYYTSLSSYSWSSLFRSCTVFNIIITCQPFQLHKYYTAIFIKIWNCEIWLQFHNNCRYSLSNSLFSIERIFKVEEFIFFYHSLTQREQLNLDRNPHSNSFHFKG